jgi:hypothetical protein
MRKRKRVPPPPPDDSWRQAMAGFDEGSGEWLFGEVLGCKVSIQWDYQNPSAFDDWIHVFLRMPGGERYEGRFGTCAMAVTAMQESAEDDEDPVGGRFHQRWPGEVLVPRPTLGAVRAALEAIITERRLWEVLDPRWGALGKQIELRWDGAWMVTDIDGYELWMLADTGAPANILTAWQTVQLRTPEGLRYAATVGTPELIARQLHQNAASWEDTAGFYHEAAPDELIVAEPRVEAIVEAFERLIATGQVQQRLVLLEEEP